MNIFRANAARAAVDARKPSDVGNVTPGDDAVPPRRVDFAMDSSIRKRQQRQRRGRMIHERPRSSPIFVRTRRPEIGRALQIRARDHLAAVGQDRGRRQEAAEFLRQQLSRPRRQCANCAMRPRRRSTAMATAWPRCASSAARRRSTSNSKRGFPPSSAWRTRSSTAPASTPMADCSRRCLARRTRSFPTR